MKEHYGRIVISRHGEGMTLGVLVLFCVLTLLGVSVWATPTGLNNIPTADVVSERTLVLQTFGNFSNHVRPDVWGGFKYGLYKNLEIGFDGQINAEPSDKGTLALQAKYKIGLWTDGTLGIGAANLGDEDRNGKTDYYAVFTHDFGVLRAHIGGSLQKNNEGGFAGLDKTRSILYRDFTLRTDIRQTNERDDTVTSLGFIYDLGYDILVETWGSFPSESGKEEVLTVKFNYVLVF